MGKDPGETGNIIQQLKNVGTDRIVDEVQKQIDEWRDKKAE